MLAKTYDPAAVEQRLYAQWETSGVFHAEPDPARRPFIISMPPPNITGRAHLGHGSTYTPMDILTRYHRMLGENADWLPGQDHAAIATEAVLVRELAREGLTRDGMGRDAFLARAWEWREEYGDIIYEAFRRLGFGPDWARDRFTMDPGLSAAVNKVFVALYNEGLIYRGTRLVNWDPKARSTLSDAEVEYEDADSTLWHIRYASDDRKRSVVVATTRPETMLGDTAVAVHPDDERYRDLVGTELVLPLASRKIPVIADAAVEREFGTGAVKVTPAHDFLDYEIGLRHDLPMPTVIDVEGKMTGDIPAKYIGMDRNDARRAIASDLEVAGALVKREPYRNKVAVSSRSGEVIEPLLSLQWFCRMETLAKPALDAYRDGSIRFVPERFGRTYEQWLENIRDWNVSRQVWWGHQLPVWYTPNGDAVVAESEDEARRIAQERHGTTALERDPDTLDTWFSSGLWPFSILGWPQKTRELQHWYPNQVMITSREIIFLWVARMVMLGMKFAGDIPFETVFITPLVFDEHGRKMSKSLGNVVDPLDLIEAYGADATRFGIVQQMRLESQELRFDERLCKKAREFNNKLWNAVRYIASLPEGVPAALQLPADAQLTLADRWILSRLRLTVEDVTAALDGFEFGVAADRLMSFAWYEYCDWYLEATKTPRAAVTRAPILTYVLNAFVRLMHPIAPFVTEEIWQALPHEGATIATATWPQAAEIPRDAGAVETFSELMKKIEEARAFRAELKIAPSQKITFDVPSDLNPELVDLLKQLANAEAHPGAARAGGLAGVTVEAPEALLRDRYEREFVKLSDEVARSEKKLSAPNFADKAPADVVAREREKLEQYRRELARVEEALAELAKSMR
ncbi:MAG TPA: valine--tRNA ligase [Candidatus Binatia bacterium]|nr:valine--tRNA ligase [Candidatus Binatia bacterium]